MEEEIKEAETSLVEEAPAEVPQQTAKTADEMAKEVNELLSSQGFELQVRPVIVPKA